MAEHTARVEWVRNGARFVDNRYARAHEWRFDGGVRVPASSSPHNVPVPLSDPSCVDPEEGFVAALASCHMLWFLSIAARRGFTVESYVDHAVGHMAPNEEGRPWMTRVVLKPLVNFSGNRLPSRGEILEMHDEAHHECYLANSVRTVITVEPPDLPA